MNQNKIRFATIGTSKITEEFLAAAKACDDFQLEAVYSRDHEKACRFAKKHGAVKSYDKLELLAADDEIDAVYIASPNSEHCRQAIMLMNAGKHILCEKAMGSNLREVEMMFQASGEHHVILLEAVRPLFDPGFHAIRDNIHKIGKIRRAVFCYCQYSSRYDSFLTGEQHNIFDTEFAAGALMDLGIYCVQPLISLFGEPLSIQAESVMLRGGIDGAGTILAKYEGMLAELIYSKITNTGIVSEIQGEAGVMQIAAISIPRDVMIIYHDGRKESLPVEPCDNNMQYELAEFIRAVRGESDVAKYNQISKESFKLMDSVREYSSITFPADEMV